MRVPVDDRRISLTDDVERQDRRIAAGYPTKAPANPRTSDGTSHAIASMDAE
jgi:hypothetical protein